LEKVFNIFNKKGGVSWISQTYDLSRKNSLKLGNILLDMGLIYHVVREHILEDEDFFYRVDDAKSFFNSDEIEIFSDDDI
jgi:hypothetical protein